MVKMKGATTHTHIYSGESRHRHEDGSDTKVTRNRSGFFVVGAVTGPSSSTSMYITGFIIPVQKEEKKRIVTEISCVRAALHNRFGAIANQLLKKLGGGSTKT